MAPRVIFIKNRCQTSLVSLKYIHDFRNSGASVLPTNLDRNSEIPADRTAIPVCVTDTSSRQTSNEHCVLGEERRFLGKLSRQVVRCNIQVSSHSSLWSNNGKRMFSSAVGGDSSHHTKMDQKYSLRGLKPEDQTSRKVSRILRTWNHNTPAELERLGVPWNPFIVCGVLKNNVRAEKAWEFFNWLKNQEGYKHNVYTYTAMIDLFGKAGNYIAMESVVEEMCQEGHSLSVVTYTILIHWYRHAKDLNGVRRVWKQMAEKSVKANVVTYTAYIDALVKGNCHLEAMEVFREMQESRCRPNIYTYTVLIHSLVEAGKLEAATELFHKLGEVNCTPNGVTYSLLMASHFKAGNFEKVLTLFRAMRESGIGASAEQRSVVSRSLEALGMPKEAGQIRSGVDELKVLLKLGSNDVLADESHEILGNEEVAPNSLPKPKELAKKLRVWGPETDAILEQIGRRLKPPYVMNVLKELRTNAALAWQFFQWAQSQEGYKHTQYTYMKVVEIVGRVSKAGSTNELMEKVLTELEQEGTNDLDKFNTLIKYYSEHNNITAAEQVFNRIGALECKANETTYTLLIDMYSRTGAHGKALEVYEEMQKAECKPSLHTYTVLMYSLARSGKMTEAETLFESLPSLGFKPSAVTYTALMKSLLNFGEDDKALALFERMREAKISPTKFTLKVLAKGLRNAGRLEEAQKIADSLPYMRGMFLEPEESQRISRGAKEVEDLVSSNFFQPIESSDTSKEDSYVQTAI